MSPFIRSASAIALALLSLPGSVVAGVLDMFADKPRETYGPFEVTAHSSSHRVGDHRSLSTHFGFSITYRGESVRLPEPKRPNLPAPAMGKTFDAVYAIESREPVLLVKLGYPTPWRRHYLLREVDGRLHTELVAPEAHNLQGEPALDYAVRRLDAVLTPTGEGTAVAEEGQLIYRLLGSSPWLLAGLRTVIDTRTLTVHRLQDPEESKCNPDVVSRSPDGNSFVRRRAYGAGLVVHDLPEGSHYAVPIVAARHRYEHVSEFADPAWFAHHFEWQPNKGGHYRLRERPGAKPLPRKIGEFTATLGPQHLEHYSMRGDHEDLAPRIGALIEREFGGVRVSPSERVARRTRGIFLATVGEYWWIGESLVYCVASTGWLEVRLVAGPEGLVEQIGKQVDARLRSGAFD